MKAFFDRYRVLRYLVSGGIGASVHLSILFALTHAFGVWYVFSTTAGFLAAFGVSFSLQKFWTFRNRTPGKTREQLAVFFSLSVCNLFLNAALMALAVGVFGVWYLAAQILVTGAIALESFFIYRSYIFLS